MPVLACDLMPKFAIREVFQALERASVRKFRGRARKIRLKRFKGLQHLFRGQRRCLFRQVLRFCHGARNPAELRRRLK